MRVVMDSDRYLYMAIPTIKRYDLGDYEEITTCQVAVVEIQKTRALTAETGINTHPFPPGRGILITTKTHF